MCRNMLSIRCVFLPPLTRVWSYRSCGEDTPLDGYFAQMYCTAYRFLYTYLRDARGWLGINTSFCRIALLI